MQYDSGKMPGANILWSPRVGFNWDVAGDQQDAGARRHGRVHRPAALRVDLEPARQHRRAAGQLRPTRANTTRVPVLAQRRQVQADQRHRRAGGELRAERHRQRLPFPQVWRSNIAVDRRLPGGITGTAEFIYNRDVNGIYYINANLPAAQTAFAGADTPRRAATSNRINNVTGNQVTSAIVMKNQDIGRNWNIAFSASKPMWHGLSLRTAYSYGEAKNTIDPGSTAFASWSSNAIAGRSQQPRPRLLDADRPATASSLSASYTQAVLRASAPPTSRCSGRRARIGNTSYIFAADTNGDGANGNDLIYIPRDTSEMNFQTFTAGGITFTADQQAAAFEAYIAQDKYLSAHRGEYAQRGAVFLPLVHRAGPEHHAGRVQEHQGQAQRRPVPHRHPELRQPAELELGRRPARDPQQHPDARRRSTPAARLSYRMQVVNNQLVTQDASSRPAASLRRLPVHAQLPVFVQLDCRPAGSDGLAGYGLRRRAGLTDPPFSFWPVL